MRLHFGCGSDYKEGFVNVDNDKSCRADMYCDLSKLPLPFKSNEADYVYAKYFLSYIGDIYAWLDDLHRICKPDASVVFVVPHFSCANVWTDIAHHRGFSASSFDCDMFKMVMKGRFRVVSKRIVFPARGAFMSWIANRFKGAYEHNLAYIFPARDVVVELRVMK